MNCFRPTTPRTRTVRSPQPPTHALKARWVLPIDRPPIDRGFVTIRGQWIVGVGKHSPPGITPRDLGDTVLFPGLVNAHTHLEFSDLNHPLGRSGMELADWIRHVLAIRNRSSAARRKGQEQPLKGQHNRSSGHRQDTLAISPSGKDRPTPSAIAAGLIESAQCGVAILADMDTSETPTSSSPSAFRALSEAASDWSASDASGPFQPVGFQWQALRQPVIFRFLEIIGFSRARADSAWRMLQQRLAAWQGCLPPCRASTSPGALAASWDQGQQNLIGLNPHAPYTVSRILLDRTIELATRENLPIAMHLAESPAELRFLDRQDGPIRDLLEERSMWGPGAVESRSRPMDYLIQLASAPRALVIHGNYLVAEELEFLASHRRRMALIYCPRTHTYFKHPPYPLARALALGVRIALGTDSRASNPDLSLLAEIRTAHRQHPTVAPASILHMGTWSGAEALGMSEIAGTLSPGKLANLAAVPSTGSPTGDPVADLVGGAEPVSHVWIGGKEVPQSAVTR